MTGIPSSLQAQISPFQAWPHHVRALGVEFAVQQNTLSLVEQGRCLEALSNADTIREESFLSKKDSFIYASIVHEIRNDDMSAIALSCKDQR